MARSRKKGNNYELLVIKWLKNLGWSDCVSSRSESKRTDDAGIDICYSEPLQIQCKAQERSLNYHEILSKMPKNSENYNLVFHKRNRSGTVVAMELDDFVKILRILLSNGSISAKKC